MAPRRQASGHLGSEYFLFGGELSDVGDGNGMQLDADANYEVETPFKSAFITALSYGD